MAFHQPLYQHLLGPPARPHNSQAHSLHPDAHAVRHSVTSKRASDVAVANSVTVVTHDVAPGAVTVRVTVASSISVLVVTWPVVLTVVES